MNFSKPISSGFHGDRVEFTKMNKKITVNKTNSKRVNEKTKLP